MKNKSYREKVEVTGSVTQINAERRTFTIATDDGLRVKALYTEETKHRVFQVAQNPEERLIKVSGMGEFAPSGALERIVKAESITIAVARWERGEVDSDSPTIGERIDARIAARPPEYWAQFPPNLVERHLAHRHGHCCRGE